ncbi:winged helix DNA-binding domain-containing protein [Jatrophihabitans endophyticus]|uniref:winged helix DNA-binding domain-containing protein n=1 Tax=Jatrophihabitans endophyticus TaxID=1206085 RepID=UPI0019F6D5EB|nr:winged helix DNA-binding domain-containing protein [Jatrophihabitans endophyticus]MBE7187407.1 AlkZ family DNA glycosylase [Jatrophihabitans endophyticus]
MGRPSPLVLERSTRHGLPGRHCDSVVGAARLTVAIQAQDAPASRLGIRARLPGVTEADVIAAVEDVRSVARTWLMRGTIHLVDAADLRWLVRLTGPVTRRRMRLRWSQMGLTDDVLDRCLTLLDDVLADGPRTRAEVRAAFESDGVARAFTEDQATTHVLLHASTVGAVCRATDRGRDATFARLADWLPDAPEGPSGDEASAELARRYFAAFAPATSADFGAWSGLPHGRAVGLIRDELTPVDVDGRPGFRLGEVEPERGVRLLPAFDNYLIGYADRAAIVPGAARPMVYQGGMIRPTVVADGAVVGSWSLPRSSGRLSVTPFGSSWPKRVLAEVEREAADVARFIGADVALTVLAPV